MYATHMKCRDLKEPIGKKTKKNSNMVMLLKVRAG